MKSLGYQERQRHRKEIIAVLEEADQDDLQKWDNDLVAYLCVVGAEGEVWCHLVLDVPELTWPQYCHQN